MGLLTANTCAADAQPFADLVAGDRNAPVQVIEYSSLTCPHCAHFHMHILPALTAKYTANKMANFVHRDFVADLVSLNGVVLARCSPRYAAFIKVLFEKQDYWAFKSDYQEMLNNIARLGGVDPKAYQQCLQDEHLKERIVATTIEGKKQYTINGVPTIIINKVIYKGKHTVEDIGQAIELASKEAAK